MKNVKLKQNLCLTGQYETYCRLKRELLCKKQYEKLFDCDYFGLSHDEIIACEQLDTCKRKQRWKINKRLKKWIEDGYNVYFITFNFNDKALAKKFRTRRNYISNMLNSNTKDYMAIIDYGEKEREHYHAMFILEKGYKFNRNNKYQLYSKWLSKYNSLYGFYNLKLIRNTNQDYNKVKNYLAKKKILSVMYRNTCLITKRKTKMIDKR